MPKSKRDKLISLTKTKKRGTKENKNKLIEEIRQCVEEYDNLYVFDYSNIRANHIKEIRAHFKSDSKIFMTKNKVMRVALGATQADEVSENIHTLTRYLTSLRGLLFTSRPKEEVLSYFNDFKRKDFPRVGFVANKTITLEQGPLQGFPSSMEERLTKLGLPIRLDNRVIELLYPYTLCTYGEPITANQAKLLKHFGHDIAEVSVDLVCRYDKKTNNVEKLMDVSEEEDGEEDDEEMQD
ncbi:hypothetical protein ABK040_006802 [Willaertia magna]